MTAGAEPDGRDDDYKRHEGFSYHGPIDPLEDFYQAEARQSERLDRKAKKKEGG